MEKHTREQHRIIEVHNLHDIDNVNRIMREIRKFGKQRKNNITIDLIKIHRISYHHYVAFSNNNVTHIIIISII